MRVLAALFSLIAGGNLAGQVPDGHYVVTTLRVGGGTGGVFVLGPRVPSSVAVTGLGTDLTGQQGGSGSGASAVAIRRSDGALLVGESARGGAGLDLHVILLRGNAVQTDVKIPIGATDGEISQIAMLPNEDVVVSLNIPNGPILAIVSPSTRTARTVPVVPQPTGFCNAVAVDGSGQNAFFAIVNLPQTTIYRVSLPSGGAPTKIGTVTSTATALQVDRTRMLLMNAQVSGADSIVSMDPANGRIQPIGPTGRSPNGMAIERATDNIAFVLNGFGPEGPVTKWMTRSGTATKLASPQNGVPSGLAVRDNPRTYGTGTPGFASYAWQVEPNPGGLPRIGNASFTLFVAVTRAIASGPIFVSPAPGNFRAVGVTVWLSPQILLPFGFVSGSGRVGLPIPNDTALVQLSLFLQSFHPDSGASQGLAATSGLRLTIMR